MSPSRAAGGRLVVVRHATAGSKLADRARDLERGLDPAGLAAAGLLPPRVLEHVTPAAIVSSPFRRCLLTVQPLALLLDLPVAVSDALLADAPLEQARALLDAVPEGSVLCTHGEWFERVLGRRLEKGGFVVLTTGAGTWQPELVAGSPLVGAISAR